jgi:hypothetical protein
MRIKREITIMPNSARRLLKKALTKSSRRLRVLTSETTDVSCWTCVSAMV